VLLKLKYKKKLYSEIDAGMGRKIATRKEENL